ncbi:MAG: hypothetical protein KGH94_01710 [Candidatus Micrarchaeota archaeon]|nr:hypothetical protein [Candidatus Micrarchaeota archaeon]
MAEQKVRPLPVPKGFNWNIWTGRQQELAKTEGKRNDAERQAVIAPEKLGIATLRTD